MNLIDYSGNVIRLTDERLAHIKEHPEMVIHTPKISETLTNPDIVVKSRSDEENFITSIMSGYLLEIKTCVLW